MIQGSSGERAYAAPQGGAEFGSDDELLPEVVISKRIKRGKQSAPQISIPSRDQASKLHTTATRECVNEIVESLCKDVDRKGYPGFQWAQVFPAVFSELSNGITNKSKNKFTIEYFKEIHRGRTFSSALEALVSLIKKHDSKANSHSARLAILKSLLMLKGSKMEDCNSIGSTAEHFYNKHQKDGGLQAVDTLRSEPVFRSPDELQHVARELRLYKSAFPRDLKKESTETSAENFAGGIALGLKKLGFCQNPTELRDRILSKFADDSDDEDMETGTIAYNQEVLEQCEIRDILDGAKGADIPEPQLFLAIIKNRFANKKNPHGEARLMQQLRSNMLKKWERLKSATPESEEDASSLEGLASMSALLMQVMEQDYKQHESLQSETRAEPMETASASGGSSGGSATHYTTDSKGRKYPGNLPSILHNDKMVRDLLNDCSDVSYKWQEIGIQLGISHGTLISMRRLSSPISEVISYWARGNIIDGQDDNTVKRLIEALSTRHVGLPGTAQQIYDKRVKPFLK